MSACVCVIHKNIDTLGIYVYVHTFHIGASGLLTTVFPVSRPEISLEMTCFDPYFADGEVSPARSRGCLAGEWLRPALRGLNLTCNTRLTCLL